MSHAAAAFADLLQSRERGKLKIYIGSAAGVGKTYRMLQEAHDLRRRRIDVVVAFVEPSLRHASSSIVFQKSGCFHKAL